MSGYDRRPPRLAEALLGACLRKGGPRDALLGDLHEMYAAKAADPSVGPRRAALWYWNHALRISGRHSVRRVVGSRPPHLGSDPDQETNDGRRNVTKGGDGHGRGVMADVVRDVQVALRGFRRTPGFLTVALATLALGVGANTAIFSVVNAVYLTPLDFRDPDRLVLIGRSAEDGSYRMATQTPGTWSDWARDQEAFAELAGFRYWTTTLERDGVASRVTAVHSLGSLFDVLGVAPMLGRTFTAADEGPGHEGLVVLSHAYWQREFGGDDPIGRTLLLDGTPNEIVGVMPPSFRFPDPGVDLWKTADLSAEELLDRDDQFINTIARIAPGRSLPQARDEMATLHAALREAHPDRLAGSTAEVVPLREALLGDVGTLWPTLMAAVGLVLLIACVNVANLLLSRAHGRSAEMALRRALGASRGRVARQLVTEGFTLAALGGLAGLGVGWLFLRGILAWMPGGVPRAEAIGVDGTVLAFTLAVSGVAGILSGALPLMRIPELSLGARMRTRRGGDGRRVRGGLVVAEVALAVVLVCGAGVALRGFASLSALDPGFDPSGRSVFHVQIQGDVSDQDRSRFYEGLERQVAALPGARAAGITSVFPMAGFTPGTFVGRPGETVSSGDGAPTVRYVGVSRSFRSAAGIPLLAGRDLTEEDGRDGTPAILLSASAASLLFPEGEALGRRIYLGPDGVVAPVATVVGVVGDVRQRGMTQPAPPMAYVPRGDIAFWRGFDLVVHGQVGSAVGLENVRRIALGLDADAVVLRPTDATRFVADALVGQRNTMLLFALMGAVALALAVVGVFGVVGFLVGQRTREMGVRLAVGAGRGELQALVLRQSLAPVVAGAALGTLGAAWISRFVEGLVVGIDPFDPITLGSVPILLVLVAGFAAWLPARRASRVDPARVLSEG